MLSPLSHQLAQGVVVHKIGDSYSYGTLCPYRSEKCISYTVSKITILKIFSISKFSKHIINIPIIISKYCGITLNYDGSYYKVGYKHPYFVKTIYLNYYKIIHLFKLVKAH